MRLNIVNFVPGILPDELAFLQAATKDLTDDKLSSFISLYNTKRKTSDTILIGCLIGFVGVSGIQRFMVGQIGMGILYFFTAGLCFVGTIIDIVNHKKLTAEYNQQMAVESMGMIQAF